MVEVLLTFDLDLGSWSLDENEGPIVRGRVAEFIELKRQLEEREIRVQTTRYPAHADADVSGLQERMNSADLVFHETPLVANGLTEAERDPIKARVEKTVHDQFLGKTHFISVLGCSSKAYARGIAQGAGIPTPREWSVRDYLDLDNKPAEAVLKKKLSHRGEGIFHIDDAKKVERAFTFDWATYHAKKVIVPQKSEYVIEEFIETPSERYSQYRIFTLGDGTILGAVLNVSASTKDKPVYLTRRGGVWTDQRSPVFLNSKSIMSNLDDYAKGGRQIPIAPLTGCHRPLEREDYALLEAHGICPEEVGLQPELESLAQGTAIEFQKQGCVFLGQDWIQDLRQRFYLLEVHLLPSRDVFNTLYNHGKGNRESAYRISIQKIADGIQRIYS